MIFMISRTKQPRFGLDISASIHCHFFCSPDPNTDADSDQEPNTNHDPDVDNKTKPNSG